MRQRKKKTLITAQLKLKWISLFLHFNSSPCSSFLRERKSIFTITSGFSQYFIYFVELLHVKRLNLSRIDDSRYFLMSNTLTERPLCRLLTHCNVRHLSLTYSINSRKHDFLVINPVAKHCGCISPSLCCIWHLFNVILHLFNVIYILLCLLLN